MHDDVDVLLLSTYDTDGAGKFTELLASSLRALGYSTLVICVHHRSDKANTVGLLDEHPVRQLTYRLTEEFDRRVFRPREEYAFIHLRGVSDRFALSTKLWPQRCRAIVCTFLSGMLSPEALLALRNRYGNPPIMFYGVDMNFYTGGCHYARDCLRYQNDCADCPAVPARLRPAVRRAFAAKQACYRKMPGHVVVSSSHDHHQQIVSSTLFRQSDVRRLLMAVDENLYGSFESERIALREAMGLSKRVLLVRSSSEPRKGCDMLVAAMQLLERQSPDTLERLEVVAVGDHYMAKRMVNLKVQLRSLGYVNGETELARIYAVADVFVNPTLADGGPVMLTQALMSGTPVITTDVGLARDLVAPSDNGWVLSQAQPQELAAAIRQLSDWPDQALAAMRLKTREKAQAQIGVKGYLEKLSGLMEELIGAA
jgi:glycosyltransferase involved in cell wall biosynthesis